MSMWRIALVADGVSQAAYAVAIEAFAQSLSAFESTPGGAWAVEALTEDEPDRIAVEISVAQAAASLGRKPPPVMIEKLPTIDWLAANRRSFPPLAIGRFFVHGSHFEGAPPAGARVIALDAGPAFGSGEHATTSLCLLAIEAIAKRRRMRRVLDLGCGSGILAIGIAKTWKPAGVVAGDIDRDAVRVTVENARRNRVGSAVRVAESDGLRHIAPRRGYDLVVANILARPLCRLAGAIARAVQPGGIVVLSGLLESQETEVRAAYRARGLVLVDRLTRNGWCALLLGR